MPRSDFKTSIFWKNEEELSARVETLKVLGAGRAATASLVRCSPEGLKPFDCVEKCFRPKLLVRFIYWCFFQSPFPYQYDRNAIGAAFYRGAVAGKILSTLKIETRPVAEPLYTRWDAENSAFVLAARFVKGRGIIPQEVDSLWIRRGIYNLLLQPMAKLFGSKIPKKCPPPEELKKLLSLMKKFEETFKSSGLIGTGWQTSPAVLVSTANLLRTDDGYVMVDLESGIPAVLVPYYLIRSLLKFRFPYFDDIEPVRLDRFLENNREIFGECLGEVALGTLFDDAEKLKGSTECWKKGEIAIFRNFPTLLMSPPKRRAVKDARAEAWLREGIIDQKSFEKLSRSERLFTQPLFLLGVFPGTVGRILRKIRGNRAYRTKVSLFFTNRQKRRQWLQEYVVEHLDEWVLEGRFPPVEEHHSISFGPCFLTRLVVSKITSPHFHRFFVDHTYRKSILIKVALFFTSEKYQLEYSKYLIYKGLLEWRQDGRIGEDEFENLVRLLNTGRIQEYVRVFGFHVALKFFETVTTAIKVAGVGWYLSSLAAHFPGLDAGSLISTTFLIALVKTAAINPISILMMVNTSVWRTLITLQRMLSIKRRRISYRTALFIGMIPVFGTLAYPVQMYTGCRELSIYIMRYILGKIGQSFPISELLISGE